MLQQDDFPVKPKRKSPFWIRWLHRLWRGDDSHSEMTAQFWLTLRSGFERLKSDDPAKQGYIERIEELLKQPPEWRSAYEIEQLMVHLYEGDSLQVELQRRLGEAKDKLAEEVWKQYSEQTQAAQNDVTRQALLARLVNDLQWRYTVRQAERKLSRQVTAVTCTVFILSVAAFAAWFGVTDWFSDRIDFYGGWSGPLALSAWAGICGAAFSMLIGLRDRLTAATLDDLKVMRHWSYPTSRIVVGLGAAFIFYFLLFCSFVPGLLGPTLDSHASPERVERAAAALRTIALRMALCEEETATAEQQLAVTRAVDQIKTLLPIRDQLSRRRSDQEWLEIVNYRPRSCTSSAAPIAKFDAADSHVVASALRIDSQSLALLVVWSFLAGFSEKLVPNLLSKKAESATSSPAT